MVTTTPSNELAEIRHHYLSCRPIAIDLFSGVGGLSLGLELAGFCIASHAEIDATAARYAEYNFPLTNTLGGDKFGDIRKIDGGDLTSGIPKGATIALIAGGPPCQGFSLAGKKDPNDPLNDLVLEMARVIVELKPLAFLIENVPGIKAGDIWQLDEALRQLGQYYDIADAGTLYAPDFGVPQTRRRVFVLGYRKDLGIVPRLPSPSHLPPGKSVSLFRTRVTPTVIEALDDLPNVELFDHLINGDEVAYSQAPTTEFQRLMRDSALMAERRGYLVEWNDSLCTNCRRTQHGESLHRRLSSLAYGEADHASGIRRLEPDGLSTTIRAGTTSERGSWSAPRPCHYREPRVLTTRECARLQTFPDWFRFHPVKWHGNRQVGNAVPVLLAEAVGRAILEQLGLAPTPRPVPRIQRNELLIADDIAKAENSRLNERNLTHQVVGTRKPGNLTREERRLLKPQGPDTANQGL